MAILLSGVGFYLFTTPVPSLYPWLLHLASIGLLILSIVWVDRSKHHEESNKDLAWKWQEIALFVAILGIAAFLRLYRLDQLPFGTWYDEATGGLFALDILKPPRLSANLLRNGTITGSSILPGSSHSEYLVDQPLHFDW